MPKSDSYANLSSLDGTEEVHSVHSGTDKNFTTSLIPAYVGSQLIGVTVQGYSAVLDATTGTFLVADQSKLDGISENANNYSHPNHTGDVTSTGDGATVIAANAVTLAMMAHGTEGNLITYDAAGAPAYVATGTAGQVLTSGGPGVAPTMADAAGGGGAWTHLSTVTAAGDTTADVETTFDSTYDEYVIVATDVRPSANNRSVRITLKIGGSYLTAGYRYHYETTNSGTATLAGAVGANQSDIIISGSYFDSSATASGNFTVSVSNPTASIWHKIDVKGGYTDSGPIFHKINCFGGQKTTTGALTGVRFAMHSGNISGTFRLYGINKS